MEERTTEKQVTTGRFYHSIPWKCFMTVLFLCGICGAFSSMIFLDLYDNGQSAAVYRILTFKPTPYELIAFLVGCCAVSLAIFIHLVFVTGRSASDGSVRLNLLDLIPLDLYLLALGMGVAGCFIGLNDLTGGFFWQIYNIEKYFKQSWVIFLSFLIILCCLLGMALCALAAILTLVNRLRMDVKIWQNTLTYRLCRLLWRVLVWVYVHPVKKVVKGLKHFFGALPLIWQSLLVLAVVGILYVFFIAVEAGFFVLMLTLVTFAAYVLVVVFMRRLHLGAEKMAQGDLEYQIDDSNMFGAFKKHADDLNHIKEHINQAVAAKMSSERMKTELITNVSHDIKTPLTSIINYVDLMKKEPVESETVREYLDIMDRQSKRLKKLIEDLIEVSKASTGNVAVQMVKTDVDVFCEQAIGEYRERLAASELTLCVNRKTTGAQIMADGKLLWRVFDNLLGNICKYSLSGTRVYLDTCVHEGKVVMTLRNISAESLNIPAEELMERFVRGDSSRHTDGSGLGLSIARNLTELQGGTLEIVIDGDLFKAIVTFPLLKE